MAIDAFAGFPMDGLRFLHELSQNNNKTWFDANKERYQAHILAHVPGFVAALGERLKAGISRNIEYDIRTNGAGSMMRIYRDVRFARDKTPYKTHIGFAFWEGPRKKMENPSFGFQFGPEGAGLYAGVFGFDKELLEAYRHAVEDKGLGAELERAIHAVQAAGSYEIGGEQSKRVPQGFDADHPRAELLKYKGLHAYSPQFDAEIVTTPDLVDVLFAHCRNMAPVQQWLVKVAAGM